MGLKKHILIAGFFAVLLCRPALGFEEHFATALAADWAAPSTPLAGSSVTAPVLDAAGSDGVVLELVYPGRIPSSYSGPGWATQLKTAAARGYGVYEARLRPAAGRAGQGVVSAFFTYFNDGLDHDGDGIVDNHEIDFEFLAAESSVIYLTVWTAYQADANGEVFRKVSRKLNLKTGQVWQTPPGSEGTYDLVETSPLGWKALRFKTASAYRTYRFEWQPTQVTFAIDIEDGQGFRTLWDLTGTPGTVIPTHPAPCFVNLWHNAFHWHTGRAARPPRRPVRFRVDRITLP